MGHFIHPPKSVHELSDGDALVISDYMNTGLHRTKRTMVSEWFPQSAVQLTWPHAGTDWAYMLDRVESCYIRLAYEIARRETLIIVTPEVERIQALLQQHLPEELMQHIIFFACPTNDTWARDHAFLTVVGQSGIELMDYRFNGWGGKFEASLDNAINKQLWEQGVVQGKYTDCLDFELEGGSIESDGRGTLLVTSGCLLNPNRNATYSKEQVEARLCEELGAERVLWLDHGNLAGDDTDGHIDTLARLCPKDTIVYVKAEDKADEHYEELSRMEAQLQTFRTMDDRPYRLLPLPLPADIYDEEGERLPATYANYLVVNGAVLYPTYGQKENDEQAAQVLAQAFQGYDIVGVDCTPLIYQHGSLHCATMQYPRGVVASPADEQAE